MDFSLSTLTSGMGSDSRVLDDALSLIISPVSNRVRRKLMLSLDSAKRPQQPSTSDNDLLFSHYRDSCKLFKTKQVRSKERLNTEQDENDDDTVSTFTSTSVDEDDESLSFCCSSPMSSRKRVSFAPQVVTAVYYRPLCTEDDKFHLHYSEHDYIDFKLDFLTKGNSPLVRKTPRRVGFVRDVISSTHTVLGMNERQQFELYYNEQELQGFLDDFVTSLQHQH